MASHVGMWPKEKKKSHIAPPIYHLWLASLSLVPSSSQSHLRWTVRGTQDVLASPQGGICVITFSI